MKTSCLEYLPLITLFISLFTGSIRASGAGEEKKGPHSAFDPSSQEWKISWPGRVSQYDPVFLSPPVDPMQGIPLGSGETGVLFWCEGSKIIAAVNKSDLWDDATFGPFRNWNAGEEDLSTTLRHACRLTIDFGSPVFSTLYLANFKARLGIADGSLALETSSPFGWISLNAFVDRKTGILYLDLSREMKEEIPVKLTIERYGSRTFSHWYSQINGDETIGLSGTETLADNEGICITQMLSSGTFAAGLRLLGENGFKTVYTRDHSRAGSFRLTGQKNSHARFALAVTSPVPGDPVVIAGQMLGEASATGFDAACQRSSVLWKTLWNRSFVDYGDDYLNTLWHLSIYYAMASQGGAYPGRFNNGLWTWDNDVQNWNFYFHWNQQQLYWPVNATGLHELAAPYLDFRYRSLPMARKTAEEVFTTKGAFVSDVTERRGFNSGSENANHTPVAEIALDFWRQYSYTCDRTFLEEKALPFILEAARFFESLFVKEYDGLYHARKGTGYEGWIELRDGLTELTYAKMLFTTAQEALKAAGKTLPEAAKWNDIAGHLAPLPIAAAGPEAICKKADKFVLVTGFNKDSETPSDTIFAAGYGLREKTMLTVYSPSDDTVYSGLKLLDGIFPSVPSSPVFPSGLIGLKDKGTAPFTRALATTLLYGKEITGWDPVPVVMARLGMKKELKRDLLNFPARWQIYCNGWGHWGVEGEVVKDAGWFFRTNNVHDTKDPGDGKIPFPMWPFRHMSMESMSVFATAVNESLLQSHEGFLRVFPAFPDDRPGRFTLHARGGFIVSSEIDNGVVRWISIRSLYGNKCRLLLPWDKGSYSGANLKKSHDLSGGIAELDTKPGEVLIFVPCGSVPSEWAVTNEDPLRNEKVRYHSSGKTMIGIPKMY